MSEIKAGKQLIGQKNVMIHPRVQALSRPGYAKDVPQWRHLGEYTVSSYVSGLVVVAIEIEASSCGIGVDSEHWMPGCSSVYMGNG